MRKIKGMGFVLDSKEINIYTFHKNTVYHYRFPELELLHTFKSLSHISYLILSKDERQIAVVNTSGTIAVHLAESGELLGKSKMEKTETFFSCYLDNDWILCADWGGKIMRMNTKSFAHEILLDLKYFEREFHPRLMLNQNEMQIVEVECESTKARIWDINSLQLYQMDYAGILEGVTDKLLFRKNYYIHLYHYGGCNDVTIFNKNTVLCKFSLPIRGFCGDFNMSENGQYIIFTDSVMFEEDSVHIFDIRSQKIVKTYTLKFVSDKDALKFVHKDKTLLIATWEGIYIDELELT